MATLCVFVTILSIFGHVTQSATIIDYLQNPNLQSGQTFNTLLLLLERTGLNVTLDAPGALTLFAPTDEAFSKIPPNDLAALGANATVLTNLLKSHVVSGFVISPQITDGSSETSLGGTQLPFRVYKNGAVMVQDATVSDADHIVRNGVVHALNKVLLPPTQNTMEYFAENSMEFSDLFAALVLTRLIPTLEGGNFTIFAPNNKAFAESLDMLTPLYNDNSKLADVLKFHVVPGIIFSPGLQDGQFLPTVLGNSLFIKKSSSGNSVTVMVNNATVIKADSFMTNGVIHTIDKVLTPF